MRWSYLTDDSLFKHSMQFLFSRVLRDSSTRIVGPSVRPSVRPSHFTFFFFLRSLASLLLPKWYSDLNYSPCPPARDWGSHVSDLVHSLSDMMLLSADLSPPEVPFSCVFFILFLSSSGNLSWHLLQTGFMSNSKNFDFLSMAMLQVLQAKWPAHLE